MKLPCEMVQDLLPLYHDGVCSEVSNTLVGAHLETCEDCARVLKNLDVEIEVPEVEMDAARPLISIKVNWDKQNRKTLLKCIGAAVLAFAVFVGCWWGLTQWCIVPLGSEDYKNLERYQLSDGCIYLKYSHEYGNCAFNVYRKNTDDGKIYDFRLRPVLGKTDEEVGHPYEPRYGLYFFPEDQNMLNSKGELIPVEEMYLGTPDDCVLLWKRGMELPAATAEQEAEYQQMLDAFAAPNAPEMPEVLGVEYYGHTEEPEAASGDILHMREETVYPE